MCGQDPNCHQSKASGSKNHGHDQPLISKRKKGLQPSIRPPQEDNKSPLSFLSSEQSSKCDQASITRISSSTASFISSLSASSRNTSIPDTEHHRPSSVQFVCPRKSSKEGLESQLEERQNPCSSNSSNTPTSSSRNFRATRTTASANRNSSVDTEETYEQNNKHRNKRTIKRRTDLNQPKASKQKKKKKKGNEAWKDYTWQTLPECPTDRKSQIQWLTDIIENLNGNLMKKDVDRAVNLWNLKVEDDDSIIEFPTSEVKEEILLEQDPFRHLRSDVPSTAMKYTPRDFQKTPSGRLIRADVSKTINPKPIPAFCELNNNNVSDLDKVIYLEKNQPKFYSKGNYKFRCACQGPCGSNCECVVASIANGGSFLMDNFVVTRLPDFYNTGLVACGSKCGCRGECSNSAANILKRVELELVRKKDIGWGIRAGTDYSTGEILFEFLGEVITRTEREARSNTDTALWCWQTFTSEFLETDMFYVSMKFRHGKRFPYPEQSVFIDPLTQGNVSRWANQSEYTNAHCIRLFVNDLSPEMCRLIFYATRPIPRGAEIFVDYGNDYAGISNCKCGNVFCDKKKKWRKNRYGPTATTELLNEINDILSRNIKSGLISYIKSLNKKELKIFIEKIKFLYKRPHPSPTCTVIRNFADKMLRKNKKKKRNEREEELNEEDEVEENWEERYKAERARLLELDVHATNLQSASPPLITLEDSE